MKKLKLNQKGFTIIEVMIVLVIAGLIMVIVFLAVPALQRNQRNTASRQEAANILAGANELSNNNNGRIPGDPPSTPAADAAEILANANAKTVTVLTIEGNTGTTAPTITSPVRAVLRTGSKCNATGDATVAGSSRQIALLYGIENNAGTLKIVCQAS